MTPTEIASIIERVPPLRFVEGPPSDGFLRWLANAPYGHYEIVLTKQAKPVYEASHLADNSSEVILISAITATETLEAAIAACNTHHRAIIAALLGGKERVDG